jgi:hypothetical protein
MLFTHKDIVLSTPKAMLQLLVLGALGGWLGGVCINASGGFISAIQDWAPYKAALVGLMSTLLLGFPWVWTMRQRGWWLSGAVFGVIASILAVLFFFLIWPYDGHGRDGVHKTVLTILGSYPIPVFGIGGLTGIFASSFIRPTQDGEHLWVDWVLPFLIVGGFVSVVGTVQPLEKETVTADQLSADELECCKVAYRAFVKKVGVSFAVFEAEKYCEVECPLVNECLSTCAALKLECSADEITCKDQHRACVLSCPKE